MRLVKISQNINQGTRSRCCKSINRDTIAKSVRGESVVLSLQFARSNVLVNLTEVVVFF